MLLKRLLKSHCDISDKETLSDGVISAKHLGDDSIPDDVMVFTNPRVLRSKVRWVNVNFIETKDLDDIKSMVCYPKL